MNATDIKNDLVDYLKTIPSIKSCEISLRSYGFYLMIVNNTALMISDNMNDPQGRPLDQEGLLIKADIKQ